jgi:hypothetical protein
MVQFESTLPFFRENIYKIVTLSPGNLPPQQGCQMVCFQTKNSNLGKFWRASEWKMLLHFMIIWNILWPFGIMYGSLVEFVVIWYIFPILVCLDQEQSGNHAPQGLL